MVNLVVSFKKSIYGQTECIARSFDNQKQAEQFMNEFKQATKQGKYFDTHYYVNTFTKFGKKTIEVNSVSELNTDTNKFVGK